MKFLLAFACLLTPVGNSTIEAVLQAVVDSPQLSPYYHEDVRPERVPLVILHNEHVPKTLRLTKFGKRVRILSDEEVHSAQIKAYLRVVRLTVEDSVARVVVEYPVEGIRLTTRLQLVDGTWHAVETSLVETGAE